MNEETNISCVVMIGVWVFDKDASNFAVADVRKQAQTKLGVTWRTGVTTERVVTGVRWRTGVTTERVVTDVTWRTGVTTKRVVTGVTLRKEWLQSESWLVSRDVQEWLQSETWLTICAFFVEYPSGKEFLFLHDEPCEEWGVLSAWRWVGKTARSS
jgi:hypothetical protein